MCHAMMFPSFACVLLHCPPTSPKEDSHINQARADKEWSTLAQWVFCDLRLAGKWGLLGGLKSLGSPAEREISRSKNLSRKCDHFDEESVAYGNV